MFKFNKYTKWYGQLIEKAEGRRYSAKKHEKHHIIPKCLGGSNRKENLVVLTFREHYIAHLLLTRMVGGDSKKKMFYALWNMINMGNNRTYNRGIKSKLYEQLRMEYSKVCCGHKRSEEWKAAHSDRMKALVHKTKRVGEANRMFTGYYITPWGKFTTTKEAVAAAPFKTDRHLIVNYCKDKNDTIINHRGNKRNLPPEYIWKTPAELGFSFESK